MGTSRVRSSEALDVDQAMVRHLRQRAEAARKQSVRLRGVSDELRRRLEKGLATAHSLFHTRS